MLMFECFKIILKNVLHVEEKRKERRELKYTFGFCFEKHQPEPLSIVELRK